VNIIAFNGSPRKGGNTQILLEEAMRGAKEQGANLKVFNLNALNLRPCQNSAIRAADRIIVASPIFFFSVSAQTKIMIDRCQAFWSEKYVLKKPVPPGPAGRKGLLILVGGMKRDAKNKGFECAEATARAFFRTVNVQEHATLEYGSVDKKGEIKGDPAALKDAYEAGKALAL
jgi:hypothetical protein